MPISRKNSGFFIYRTRVLAQSFLSFLYNGDVMTTGCDAIHRLYEHNQMTACHPGCLKNDFLI